MLFTNPILFSAEAILENRRRLRFNPEDELLNQLLSFPEEEHKNIALTYLKQGDIDAYLTTLLAGSISSNTEKHFNPNFSPTTSYERFQDNINLAVSLLSQSYADNLMLRLGIFYDSPISRFERTDYDLEGKAREITRKYKRALEKRHKSGIGLEICLVLEELAEQTIAYITLLKSIRDTSFRITNTDLSGILLDLS